MRSRLLHLVTGAALLAAAGAATLATPNVASASSECPAVQVVSNGGFESGSSGWTASSGVISSGGGESAHTGSSFAWLDGYGSSHTDSLSQSVTLPTGCNSVKLSFWLHVDTAESGTTAYDKLTAKIGSSTL